MTDINAAFENASENADPSDGEVQVGDETTPAPESGEGSEASEASAEGSEGGATEVNNRKKPHTSPRVIMGREVQDCIASLRTAWEKEGDSESKTQVLSVLATLSSSVETLMTSGHPKDPNATGKVGRPAGPPKSPLAGKSHYVGELKSGGFVYVNTGMKVPTQANYPQLSHLYGFFRTEDGARYRIAHTETLESCNKVW